MKRYEEELKLAKSIAFTAGGLMVSDSQKRVPIEYKTDGSFLTDTEKKISNLFIKNIKQKFPGHSIFSEEEGFFKSGSNYTWVCDPIDGSIPYVLGIPTAVFSIALVNKHGDPVLAVVYEPFMKQMYWATKKGGAYQNKVLLKVNENPTVSTSIIGNSGRSSQFIDAKKYKRLLFERSYRPIVTNSVIYESMLVASGKISATVMTGSAFHDAVSAKLIVEEAGGKVTNLFGEEQRYDEYICGAVITNGRFLHDELVNIAKKLKL